MSDDEARADVANAVVEWGRWAGCIAPEEMTASGAMRAAVRYLVDRDRALAHARDEIARLRSEASGSGPATPQTPRDHTGDSPPLETDPRARRCDKHSVLLYPGELCHACCDESRGARGA